MKKLTLLVTVFLATCFLSEKIYGAHGDLININFRSSDYTGDAFQDGGTPQTWNVMRSQSGTSKSLDYTVGEGVGTPSLTYAFNGRTLSTSGFDSASEAKLMNGYVWGNMDMGDDYVAYTNITNLEPDSHYKLYIYTQNTGERDNGQLLTVTVNGSLAVTQSAPSDYSANSYILGQNVLVTTVTTDNTGTLAIDYGTVGTRLAIVNGIQIEALPEPGSIILLGVGGIFILWFRHKMAKESSAVNG